MSAVQELTVRRNGPFAGYSDEPTPLAGYALLLAGWTGLFGGLLVAGDRRGILPERIATGDIVLTGIATHKLTRIVTRDWVTSPIRAPFVRYEASVGGGEVSEKARGRGLRRAVGDLLTCPFCTGPWVAGALVAGLVVRPRATRILASAFSAVALSDFLHRAWQAARDATG